MPTLTRRAALGALAATAVAASTTPTHAAPSSRLIDPRWMRQGSDPGPDHGAWDEILRTHVAVGDDGIARMDYRRVPRPAVEAYIATLAAFDPASLSRDAGFAYWANLYNALTVSLVLEAYPVRSIKSVRGGLFNTGPWTEKVVSVAGARLSLDDIEHGIMRPIWQDPRVHYAVNCAALGCPNLQTKAWIASTLSADLDVAARAFVNHPRGAMVTSGRLTVSSIYEWFQADFGGTDQGVIAHLARHAGPQLAAQLDGITRVSGDRYDWDLNDLQGARSS
ncbi:MAG: DUF547 domain-containing protein [Pseudomonadota bacterium]